MGNSSLGGDRWQMKKKKQREEAPASPSTPIPMQKAQYDVRISEEAQKGLDEIPRNIQKAMYDKIEQLKSYPEVSGIKRMWGEAYGKERMKFWDWRMEFTSDEKTKTILVTKVGHRDTLYDEYHHP